MVRRWWAMEGQVVVAVVVSRGSARLRTFRKGVSQWAVVELPGGRRVELRSSVADLGCLVFQTASDATEFAARARLALQPSPSVATVEMRWSAPARLKTSLHVEAFRASFCRDEVSLSSEGIEESLVVLAMALAVGGEVGGPDAGALLCLGTGLRLLGGSRRTVFQVPSLPFFLRHFQPFLLPPSPRLSSFLLSSLPPFLPSFFSGSMPRRRTWRAPWKACLWGWPLNERPRCAGMGTW